MDAMFKTVLRDICSTNKSAALVTITMVKGSTPRKPGAKMLVTPDGQIFGTIGGGCGESEVRQQALFALSVNTPLKHLVSMTNDLAEAEGMVCGGVMEVLIDLIGPDTTADKMTLLAYLDALDNHEKPILITVTGGGDETVSPLGRKLLITASGQELGSLGDDNVNEWGRKWAEMVSSEGKNRLVRDRGIELFIEPAPTTVRLLILGAGHIALPLATMAKILDYHVTIVDDRPFFANPARFQSADQVICNDFVQAIRALTITPETFVVIVTRGHRHDKLCLQEVINQPAGYIGMIGSRRRVKALLSELQNDGISPDLLNRVHSPIGLDLAAETPQEIALSILAELVKVHRGGKAQSLKITTSK